MNKRLALGAIAAMVAAVMLGRELGIRAAAQQPRACLHGSDESSEQRTRRASAVGTARSINTAQARAFRESGSYLPLEQLQFIAPTPGFVAALTSDGRRYTFSIKDRNDPCAFSLFSDQDGLIYTAQPLQ